MKKMQLLFAILAFVTASIGVFASEKVFATIYYEDTPAAGTCDLELLGTMCNDSGTIPCQSNGNNVWKRVDNGECTQVFRTAQ